MRIIILIFGIFLIGLAGGLALFIYEIIQPLSNLYFTQPTEGIVKILIVLTGMLVGFFILAKILQKHSS